MTTNYELGSGVYLLRATQSGILLAVQLPQYVFIALLVSSKMVVE
jgi:hypothetical protein